VNIWSTATLYVLSAERKNSGTRTILQYSNTKTIIKKRDFALANYIALIIIHSISRLKALIAFRTNTSALSLHSTFTELKYKDEESGELIDNNEFFKNKKIT